MTGEITLRGRVLPIGGLKSKILAAHLSGAKTIILPKKNEKDLRDIPEEIRKQMKLVLVDSMDQVLEAALRRKPSRSRDRARQDTRRRQGARVRARVPGPAWFPAAGRSATRGGDQTLRRSPAGGRRRSRTLVASLDGSVRATTCGAVGVADRLAQDRHEASHTAKRALSGAGCGERRGRPPDRPTSRTQRGPRWNTRTTTRPWAWTERPPRRRSRRPTAIWRVSCTRTRTPATRPPRPGSSRSTRPTRSFRTRRSAPSTTCSAPTGSRSRAPEGGGWAGRERAGFEGDPFGPGGPFAGFTGFDDQSGNVRYEFHTAGDAGISRTSSTYSSVRRPRRGPARDGVHRPARRDRAARAGAAGPSRTTGPAGTASGPGGSTGTRTRDGGWRPANRAAHSRTCSLDSGRTLAHRLGPPAPGTRALAPGEDIEVEVDISLEEAFHGSTRLVQVGEKRLEVKVPAGVETGSKIRLSGKAGSGGGAGDLYLIVKVAPHADLHAQRRGPHPRGPGHARRGAARRRSRGGHARRTRPAQGPRGDPAGPDDPPHRQGHAAPEGRGQRGSLRQDQSRPAGQARGQAAAGRGGVPPLHRPAESPEQALEEAMVKRLPIPAPALTGLGGGGDDGGRLRRTGQ